MSPLRIIVSGLVGLQPVGGMAWHYLQYVVGLSRLGHEVVYHEDTWTWPYNPVENRNTDNGEYSARFIADFFERFAPTHVQHWHYLHLRRQHFGMSASEFRKFAATADLFLNISGANFIPESLPSRCVKVFLDTDPGYNQVVLKEKFAWSESVDRWFQIVADHDIHLTFGENINEADCLIPRLDWEWLPTRMPILINLWQPDFLAQTSTQSPWTTIMSWNVFKGPVIHKNQEYGDKSGEFEKIFELPTRTDTDFELALAGGKVPYEALKGNKWKLLDALQVTRTAESYRSFIWNSKGEVSIAKHIYSAMNTGWFSDRSACYLASGRPVILQDTGFSKILPTGEGLLTFNTLEEAIEAVEVVEGDYDRHSKIARAIAYEYLESDRILTSMIEDISAWRPK